MSSESKDKSQQNEDDEYEYEYEYEYYDATPTKQTESDNINKKIFEFSDYIEVEKNQIQQEKKQSVTKKVEQVPILKERKSVNK